jgi:hypothetical protein
MHLYTAHATSPNHCPSIRARDYSRVSPQSKFRTTKASGNDPADGSRGLYESMLDALRNNQVQGAASHTSQIGLPLG